MDHRCRFVMPEQFRRVPPETATVFEGRQQQRPPQADYVQAAIWERLEVWEVEQLVFGAQWPWAQQSWTCLYSTRISEIAIWCLGLEETH